jgi:hypothetical protein
MQKQSGYTVEAKLREAYYAAQEQRAEIEKLDAMKSEIEAEHGRIVASGAMDDKDAIAQASACQVKLAMLPHKRQQLETKMPPLVAAVQQELLNCIRVCAPVARAAREHLSTTAAQALAPFFGGDASELSKLPVSQYLALLADCFPANGDLVLPTGFLSTPSPEEDYVMSSAGNFLTGLAEFKAALKTHAAILPKGYAENAFPKSDEEFQAAIPERYRPGAAAEVQPALTKEEQLKQRERAGRIDAFRKAHQQRDSREMTRLADYLAKDELAEAISLETDGIVTAEQVYEVIGERKGAELSKTIRKVQELFEQARVKVEQEHTAAAE